MNEGKISPYTKCLNSKCERPAAIRGVCSSCRVMLQRALTLKKITREEMEKILAPSKKVKNNSPAMNAFLRNMGLDITAQKNETSGESGQEFSFKN